MKDFSFQGKVWLATRGTNGKPLALRWVDDASELQVKLTADKSERTESYSGNRLTSAVVQKGNKATFSLKLNAFLPENLALGLFGTPVTVSTGTVTAESFPLALENGDTIALAHSKVSSVVVTDSAGTPATLTPGTDYSLENTGASGLLNILNVGSYTQPFKAAYSFAGGIDVAMFTQPAPERYLILDGINTVSGERVVVRLYRCHFDPSSQLDLISADFGELPLTGDVLFDSINAADATLGGFGKIELAA